MKRVKRSRAVKSAKVFRSISFDCPFCTNEDALDELTTLTSPLLLELHEDCGEKSDKKLDADFDRPQHRVTNFLVHDRNSVICAFDAGKIEAGEEIFLCGYVKPVYDESNDKEKALCTKQIGPLVEWWFAGFDGGSKAIIGVETQFASYLFIEPNENYEKIFRKSEKKILITKLAIEYLVENSDSNYEDLIEHLTETCTTFSEDFLLEISPFIYEQIINYDFSEDDNDLFLCASNAVQELVSFAGLSVNTDKEKSTTCHLRSIARVDARRFSNSDSYTTTTPLVREFFDAIFKDVFETNDNSKAQKRNGSFLNNSKLALERQKLSRVVWVDDSYKYDDCSRRSYYKKARVNSKEIQIGDFIIFFDLKNLECFGQIIFMFEESDRRKTGHILKYRSSKNTFLGESLPSSSVFLTKTCCEINLVQITDTNEVCLYRDKNLCACSKTHHCRFWYDDRSGRIEDLPKECITQNIVNCWACHEKDKIIQSKQTKCENVVETIDNITYFETITIYDVEYHLEDCVYLLPEAYDLDNSLAVEEKCPTEYDEIIYTERYRKLTSEFVKGANNDVPLPFRIVQIKKIFIDSDSEMITGRLFYRPQNVMSYGDMIKCDINLIYYSKKEITCDTKYLAGRCSIMFRENDDNNFYLKPNTWYFIKCFDPIEKKFIEVDEEVKEVFKVKNDVSKQVKCNVLELFAGCGGLALGFELGLSSSNMWAIEKDPKAVASFRENFPSAIVLEDDVNRILKLLLEGKIITESQQRLPLKGEIDVIIGGPPCQGFSGMNRFSSRQYSLFKNSLIVSFLSYIDFYRPKYLLFENVRNFIVFKQSMILKLMISCLIKMGYQCDFGVLQAGNFGVPQTRRRAVVLGALSSYHLPHLPNPNHVFSSKQCQLNIIINERKFTKSFNTSAPYRTITVADAISDMPSLNEETDTDDRKRQYKSEPISHYQQIMRKQMKNIVSDHVCKEINPLCRARIENIPRIIGADWRDLPNIRYPLCDGNIAVALEYKYDDPKNGNGPEGTLRGVCICAEGGICNGTESRQENTLIPWCLVHTANRQYQWAGLYGRLGWSGFFPTTVTNPEPISKQGRVLHPEDHRVISVREAARSQGFPDHFKFAGSVMDRYRQIGNAVPPPLATAIALEIRKCWELDHNEERCISNSTSM